MICNKCNTEFEGNFCPNCGAKIEQLNTPPNENIKPDSDKQDISKLSQSINSNNHKKMGLGFTILIVFLIIMVLGLLFACTDSVDNNPSNNSTNAKAVSSDSNSKSNTDSDKDNSEDKKQSETQTKKLPEISEEDYKAQCISIPYDDLARTPDKYIGSYVKLSGKIIQVLESNNEATYRINITKNEWDYYEDTIIASFDLTGSASRFLEDDIVEFYGMYGGLYTYTSTMNAEITIPCVYIKYMNLTS